MENVQKTSVNGPDETATQLHLTLLSTEACHLCDEAEALLKHAREAGYSIAWERVDIANDDALFERYGWLIPVLVRDGNAELHWPFDPPALASFLEP